MPAVPPRPVHLDLTSSEADALLQILLEARTPAGVDETVVDRLLLLLTDSLPEIATAPLRNKAVRLVGCR